MGNFAVIDTETNWADQVMSIGTVIADTEHFDMIDAKYQILTPEYLIGGMYESTLFLDAPQPPEITSRKAALEELKKWFSVHQVTAIFAYNASFDHNHLPELRHYCWFDIMRLAAYRQFNPRIPADAPCCSTGRLKRGYGVEAMLQLLSDNRSYRETHNAIWDAMDELEIMRKLGHTYADYIPL